MNNIKININDTNRTISGEILNINSRAISFICDEKIDDNNIYFFSFILPKSEKLQNIKGRISKQKKCGNKYLTLLIFFNIPKVDMLEIYKYIEKNQ